MNRWSLFLDGGPSLHRSPSLHIEYSYLHFIHLVIQNLCDLSKLPAFRTGKKAIFNTSAEICLI